MNKFYKQHIILQWMEAILLSIIGFYPALMIMELAYIQPWAYLLFLIYLPIAQFTLAPVFTLTGIYTYYSPMLLGYMANDRKIDLHSGSSFDYLFVMSPYKRGIECRNRLLIYQLEGLLQIIAQIEKGAIPETVDISGTSYYFNERTIAKLGFEQGKPSLFYRINLVANIIDLVWMYSVSRGRFAIPNIWSPREIRIKGIKLVNRKDYIEVLHKKISSKLSVQ